MANRVNETTLRIRAQNLAKKDLREVSKDLDAIADSQKKNADGAGLAARSVRDLTREQRELSKVAGELQRRGGILGKLSEQRQVVADAARKVGDLQRELSELGRIKASGTALGDVDKAIRNVQKQITQANRDLARQTSQFQTIAGKAQDFGVSLDGAADAAAEITRELTRVERLQQDARESAERHAQALQDAAARQREVAAEAARRNALEASTAADVARFQRESEDRARRALELARLRADIEKRSAAAGFGSAMRTPVDTGVQFGPAADANNAAMARQMAIRQRLSAVLERNDRQERSAAQSQTRLASLLNTTTNALTRQNNSLDKHHNLMGIFADTGRKSLSVYQRLRGELLSLIAVYGGLNSAIGLVQQSIAVDQERQGTLLKLKVANDDSLPRAQKDVEFLRKEADRLGLRLSDLSANYANFKIAARAAGLTQKQVADYYIMGAESITAMRLSADDAGGVMRAFTQILSKNKVQAEELNQQLGDRLPGAIARFQQSMVESGRIAKKEDLAKMMEEGKVGIQDFLNFIKFYNVESRGSLEETSKSLQANFARLKNAYDDFLADFASQGVASGLNDVVNELIDKLKGEDGKKFASDLAAGFALVGKVLLICIQNFDKLVLLGKLFLSVMAVKAVVGLAAAFGTFAGQALSGVAALIRLAAAARTAAAGTGLLGASLRSLSILAGPVGVALAGVAALFLTVGANARAAQAQTEAVITSIRKLNKATGASLEGQVAQSVDELNEISRKIQATRRQINERRTGLANGTVSRVQDNSQRYNDKLNDRALNGTAQSLEGLMEQEKQLRAQFEALDQASRNANHRLQQQKKAQAKLDAEDAAEKPTITNPTASGDDADKARKKAEAEAKAAENAAERRRDIADQAARDELEIEKKLAEARMRVQALTDEQIAENLALRMREIGMEIEQQRIQLEGRLRDAERAGSTDGAAAAKRAIANLPNLEKELKARASFEASAAKLEAKEQRINDLIAERNAKIAAVNQEVEAGVKSEVLGRQEVLDIQRQYRDEITAAIDDLIAKLSDPMNADLFARLGGEKFIAQLRAMRTEAQATNDTTRKIAANLGGQFAQGAASALTTLAKGLAGAVDGVNSIGDAFKNAGAAFANFIADFLVGIAEAILQAIILEAIMAALGYGSGANGTANYAGAVQGALTRHNGGLMNSTGGGKGNPTRYVSPLLFLGAPKFHGGGVPGLKSDEVPAILKKNEEVLTRDDPRHVLNGATANGPAAAPMDVTVVNAVDSQSVFEAGINTRQGQRLVLNVIRANRAELKRVLA